MRVLSCRFPGLPAGLTFILLLAACADEATTPRPTPPAPDAATIIVSDSNVVLNTMVQGSIRDTAMVTVQAGTGSLAALTTSIRYTAGEPEGWLST